MAVYAKPRATLDIDIMIDTGSLEKTIEYAEELGFTIHAAPMKLSGGAVHIHRLTKIDEESGDRLMLDLLIVTPKTKIAWESRIAVEWEGGTLKVVSPSSLILLKSLRKSGQDEDDIEYLRSIIDED